MAIDKQSIHRRVAHVPEPHVAQRVVTVGGKRNIRVLPDNGRHVNIPLCRARCHNNGSCLEGISFCGTAERDGIAGPLGTGAASTVGRRGIITAVASGRPFNLRIIHLLGQESVIDANMRNGLSVIKVLRTTPYHHGLAGPLDASHLPQSHIAAPAAPRCGHPGFLRPGVPHVTVN